MEKFKTFSVEKWKIDFKIQNCKAQHLKKDVKHSTFIIVYEASKKTSEQNLGSHCVHASPEDIFEEEVIIEEKVIQVKKIKCYNRFYGKDVVIDLDPQQKEFYRIVCEARIM